MALIPCVVDESRLLKREQVLDNDNEYTTTVEYCLRDCPGPAHTTNVPDAPSHFCHAHVHRSAFVTLKRGLEAASALEGF